MSTAIVLAGGLGTRLRSVVQDIPKPMAPVQGRPFLEWVLGYYRAQGITRFILSVGHLAHIIQDHFGNEWQGCPISYSAEVAPLGTGGAILQASTLLKPSEDSFLALNGDTFFAIDWQRLQAFHSAKQADITLSAFHSKDIQRYMGIQTSADGRITQLNTRSQSGKCLVNGGAYLIQAAALKPLTAVAIKPQSWENDTLPQLLAKGNLLYANAIQANFIDIGIPADFERAQTVNFYLPFLQSIKTP